MPSPKARKLKDLLDMQSRFFAEEALARAAIKSFSARPICRRIEPLSNPPVGLVAPDLSDARRPEEIR